MNTWIREHRKAIMGGLSTGIATLVTAWADGTMTGGEWAAVALAAMAGGGLVFQIPNARPSTEP